MEDVRIKALRSAKEHVSSRMRRSSSGGKDSMLGPCLCFREGSIFDGKDDMMELRLQFSDDSAAPISSNIRWCCRCIACIISSD